jgi:threonine dehydrogenase-like Zn-dependent dehydrogenase
MNVLASGRADLRPLVTHRFRLEQIEEAYELSRISAMECSK